MTQTIDAGIEVGIAPGPDRPTTATAATGAATAAAPAMTLRRGWPILLALILATAAVTVDNTILNVALPSIAGHLRASESALQWIGNAYSLLFGGLLLAAGNLADRLGRKRVLIGGLIAFATTSALVVFVTNTGELIGLRALTGAAAAFVMPSTLALLYRVFEGPARMAAMTAWSMITVVGFVGGPLLGGLILAHFDWQAVFLINIPIAAVALLATIVWVPESADPSGRRADLPGAALSIVMLAGLVYGLVTGPVSGWTGADSLLGFGTCIAAAAAFWQWELRTTHPLLPIRLLARRSLAGPALAEGALMFSIAGLLFVLTQLLQLVDGYSPLQAGLRTAPAALGSLLTGALGVWVARRFGQHRCAAIGYLLCAAGLVVAGITIAGPYWQLAIGLVVFGAGLRMAMTPVALAVINGLPKESAGMGSALNDTFQEIGGALGVAVLGSLLNSQFRHQLTAHAPAAAHQPLTHVLASGNAQLVALAHDAFQDGAQLAFAVTAALMVIAGVVALATVPRHLVDDASA